MWVFFFFFCRFLLFWNLAFELSRKTKETHNICLCFMNNISYYRHNFELSSNMDMWFIFQHFMFQWCYIIVGSRGCIFICWDFPAGRLYALECGSLFLLHTCKIKNICPDLIKNAKHPEAMGQIFPSNLW